MKEGGQVRDKSKTNSLEKAYWMGRRDAWMYTHIPLATAIQGLYDLGAEETVCYMNGVGDALAGL